MSDRVLSTREAAAVLGVDSSRIRQLCLSGQLVGVKVGRDWVIRESDLEKARDRPKRGRPRKAT